MTTRWLARVTTLGCAAALSLTALPPSSLAAPWPPSVTVSDPATAVQPLAVTVGVDGTTTAVWPSLDTDVYPLRTSHRPPAGSWTSPTSLSGAGRSAEDHELVSEANGGTTAVWSRYDGTDYRVQSASRAPAGPWGAPVNLSLPGGDGAYPQLAAAADGTLTAVWYRHAGPSFRIQSSTRPPGGTWTAPVFLTDDAGTASGADIAVAPDGTVTAVWARNDGANLVVQASSRLTGGTWSEPVTLSQSGQNSVLIHVAVATDGTAAAVWQRSDGTNLRIQAATRAAGGVWGSPVNLSAASNNAFDPQVATSGGTFQAIWSYEDASGSRIQSSRYAPGGVWGSPANLSDYSSFSQYPTLAGGPSGLFVAAWRGSVVLDSRPYVSLGYAGAWSPPDALGATGQIIKEPRVAVGAEGTVAVGWSLFTGGVSYRNEVVVVDKLLAPPAAGSPVPETSAIKGKKVIKKAKAKYRFTSTSSGATFQCRVDKKKWKACSSPYLVKAKTLRTGKHKLYVRAVLGTRVDPTPSVKKLKVL